MSEMSAIEIIFWISVALMLYTLKGYPLALAILARLKKEPVYPKSSKKPIISFIVAAYNEEKNITAKLKNLRRIEYDADRVEFIIGSDASTDGTDDILATAANGDTRIKTFRIDRRGGKIAVLHEAVKRASGDILVFTDCSVMTDPDFIPVILSSFENEKVGLVSSRDVWVKEGDHTPLSQRSYIDYEMTIRRHESRLNSLVSASGSFFAVRRHLFRSYGADQADDFALPLQVYRQGFKVIHRDDLIGYVPMVMSSGAEITRRKRIIQAGIRTVLANASLLNPIRYPVFAWQLWSHKALKWLFPFIVGINIVLAGILWPDGIVYRIIVAGYAAIALAAAAGYAIPGQSALFKPIRTAHFVLLSMVAVVGAWYNVLTGSRIKSWEPTHR